MEILIVEGDALKISADVLVLKYAQDLYGVDELVVNRLEAAGSQIEDLPRPGRYKLITISFGDSIHAA
jgi:hypothetical protein